MREFDKINALKIPSMISTNSFIRNLHRHILFFSYLKLMYSISLSSQFPIVFKSLAGFSLRIIYSKFYYQNHMGQFPQTIVFKISSGIVSSNFCFQNLSRNSFSKTVASVLKLIFYCFYLEGYEATLNYLRHLCTYFL